MIKYDQQEEEALNLLRMLAIKNEELFICCAASECERTDSCDHRRPHRHSNHGLCEMICEGHTLEQCIPAAWKSQEEQEEK